MPEITARLSTALAGRYRIEHRIGEGGMATVYLAHDPRHDRKVALKVLRPELAAVLGAERFVQEIKTTAHLQHPHILPLYDSGEAEGFLYYVMPFIEGETLRQKLSRETQLPIDEAVRITRDVAEALDYAHRQGVVHRDIKPENILLQDGRSLVADFGIALAVSAAAGGRMTETGLSLGTPHYMSPEQATAGKTLTHRSDIYSLGAVLYEMLTGSPPHTGASAQQIIMKIVTDEPAPVTRARKTVPPHVAAALGQSLEKLPADRFESAKAFAAALGNQAFTVTSTRAVGGVGPQGISPRVFAAVVGVAAVFAAISVSSWLRRAPPPRSVVRFEISPPASGPGEINLFAVSPDGSTIIWNTANLSKRTGALWVRRLGDVDLTPLRVTAGFPGTLSFSPAGDEVAFTAIASFETGTGALQIVPLAGGPTRTLADTVDVMPSWGSDGYIYFSYGGGLKRVLARGGPIEDLTSPSRDYTGRPGPLRFPTALPGGRGVLAWSITDSVGVLDLRSRKWRMLVRGGQFYDYVEPGYLLYVEDLSLMAVPFSLDDLTLRGTPRPIIEGVGGTFWSFAVGGGTLVYQNTGRTPTLALRRRDGITRALPGIPEGVASSPAVSPDGRRLAMRFQPIGSGGATAEIWVYELPAGPAARLTFAQGLDSDPTWTRDGLGILYTSNRGGKTHALYLQDWDGNGAAQLVLQRNGHLWRTSWLPDGDHFVFEESEEVFGPVDLYLSSRSAPDSVRPLVVGPFDEGSPAVSPDGRWLAYHSNESGRMEVYIRPLEGRGARRQISRQGGRQPAWAHSSRELFFENRDTLYTARLGDDPVAGEIQPLFRISATALGFAVMPGDSLFVLGELAGVDTVARPVMVVLNFDRELEALFRRKR